MHIQQTYYILLQDTTQVAPAKSPPAKAGLHGPKTAAPPPLEGAVVPAPSEVKIVHLQYIKSVRQCFEH